MDNKYDLMNCKTLEDYKNAKIGFQEAIEALKKIPFENIGFARIDHHREMRKGIPEAIFGMGKTPEQILEIVRSMSTKNSNVLITRTNQNVYEIIKTEFPICEISCCEWNNHNTKQRRLYR